MDPEILGRDFERSLPEPLRKSRGAFYTPPVIVDYMCRESLRHYLYTALDNPAWNADADAALDAADRGQRRSFAGGSRAHEQIRAALESALESVTVLDPACGTGAFLVGMLRLLFTTRKRLSLAFNAHETKNAIIRHNLYGVDIEGAAVDIARLRLQCALRAETGESRTTPPETASHLVENDCLLAKNLFQQTAFDIVIGNPPYRQLQAQGGELADRYAGCGFETFVRRGDLYQLFYERGRQLLKPRGHLCFITSNKWMRSRYGEATRAFFAKRTNPKLLVDLGSGGFEDAAVDTNILLFAKEKNAGKCICSQWSPAGGGGGKNVFGKRTVMPFTASSAWVVLSEKERQMKAKIEAAGKPLGEWDIHIFRGILTGYNAAFVIDGKKKDELIAADPRSAELIKPILRGKDITPKGYTFADRWLINTHNGIKESGEARVDINEYPAVKKHLDVFYQHLAKRLDKGATPYNLRSCAYLADFEKEKIAWGAFGKTDGTNNFVLAAPGLYILGPMYFLTGAHLKWLYALLNAKALRFIFPFYFPALGEKTEIVRTVYLKRIPIPVPTPAQEAAIAALVDRHLAGEATGAALDDAVYALYG
ncbi:MAG: Eco57I restriction-modification methylase domain-containing protein [Treponema sp.]|jgi:hypothetical protein|nr:Eco57I restriction-modification methylase domain-containing protein [Treponema sp.]